MPLQPKPDLSPMPSAPARTVRAGRRAGALCGGICTGCGAPGTTFCRRCADGVVCAPAVDVAGRRAVVWAAYDGAVRDALRRAKFGRAVAWWRIAGVELAACLDAAGVLAHAAGFVPVPTPAARRRARGGADHTALIVAALASETGLAPLHLLVPADAASRAPQHRRDAHARRTPEGPRWLVVPASLPGEVIVVDDVVTTGATLASAVRALAACGVACTPAAVAATPRVRRAVA